MKFTPAAITAIDRLIALDPADEIKERYGAETLEDAFMAATGRAFEAEEDEDAERGVFA